MTRYTISLASSADDAQLRERMALDRIEGAAAISLRREPSYFAGSRLYGAPVQVIVGRDASTGRIVATGCRSVATAHLDGKPQRVAYLSDLRIDPEHRNGFLLARVYRYLRTLHEADPLPCHTLIYEDNQKALGSLVGGRAGLPRYVPRARLIARGIRLGRKRAERSLPGIELRRATADELDEIVYFVNARRAAHPWSAALDRADFSPGGRCDTLRAEDFFVARRHGRICATVAAWDQGRLRQAHIERYARVTQLLRVPYNILASVRGLPKLPALGEPLPYLYLAFIAVQDDDALLCAALLRHVSNELSSGRWLYALATLHEDDPLLPQFLAYPGTTSVVRLFEVDFSQNGECVNVHVDAPSPQRANVEFALA